MLMAGEEVLDVVLGDDVIIGTEGDVIIAGDVMAASTVFIVVAVVGGRGLVLIG